MIPAITLLLFELNFQNSAEPAIADSYKKFRNASEANLTLARNEFQSSKFEQIVKWLH